GAFDPDIPEEGASTPPPGWLHNIHGYQGHGRAGEIPASFEAPGPVVTPKEPTACVRSSRVPKVSEDQAREALLRFVESRWRYSSKPARNLAFRQLQAITVYRHLSRCSPGVLKPLPPTGQPVDGAEFGVSPPPWEIPVPPPQIFTDRVETLRVPHSNSSWFCPLCSQLWIQSPGPAGPVRRNSSWFCPGGSFSDVNDPWCHFLSGRCSFCQGRGFKTCSACQGSQNLVKNNVSNFEKVSGEPFFLDENTLVYPLQGFPDLELCDASARMIHEHLERFSSTSRILQQRQTIELLPLTQAHYRYNGKDFSFFVYGVENQVFLAKYPSVCSLL
uniref:Ssu-2 homolog n=1 Tax=Takifugu rubripes TaxID=31033 RepID=A0A674P702_TAKRU